MFFNCARLVYPVPKSSIESLTPISYSRESIPRSFWVGDDRRLGDLQGELIRWNIVSVEQFCDLFEQSILAQVASRQVDGHRKRGTSSIQLLA